MSDLDYDALRAAHRSSYPMGNRHHGTPERPDWGTFCVECKDSWPCDVARLLDLAQRAEAAERELEVIRNLAMEHMNCSGCPTPWWLKQALGTDPKEDQ